MAIRASMVVSRSTSVETVSTTQQRASSVTSNTRPLFQISAAVESLLTDFLTMWAGLVFWWFLIFRSTPTTICFSWPTEPQMRPFSAPWSSRSSQPPAPVTSSTWWALTVVDRTTLSLTTIQFSTHVTLVSTFIREIQLNMKLPGYWRKSSCRFDTVYDLKSRKEKPHYSLFSGHVVKYNYRQPALMPRYEPPSGEFFFGKLELKIFDKET